MGLVELLTRYGMEMQSRDRKGQTALHLVCHAATDPGLAVDAKADVANRFVHCFQHGA